ncbi:hypothetical protein K439DRAFT_1624657 [Ramaria rubella]|nr:hypothetical protein K439DRAFT_1624657 [Ramaria rubella]
MSPIEQIPVEILGHIFVECMPKYSLQRLACGGGPFCPLESHPNDVRQQLCRVCRHWREVMLASPEIWAIVALDRPVIKLEGLERLLEQSRWRLMDVWIDGSHLRVKTEDCQRLVAVIGQHASRIRSYALTGNTPRDCDMQWENLFLAAEHTDMPCLRHIFNNTGEIWRNNFVGKIMAANLTTLKTVTERGINCFSTGSFIRLIRLDVTWTSSHSTSFYLELLGSCPQLEDLHWRETSESPEDEGVNEALSRIFLPHLKRLLFEAEYDAEHIDARVLGCLRIPGLEDLELSASWKNAPTDAMNALNVLFWAGLPSLKRLVLDGVSLVLDGVSLEGERGMNSSFFECLSSVRRIVFYSCDLDESFFSTWSSMRERRGKSPFRLEQFQMEYTTMTGSDLGLFLELIWKTHGEKAMMAITGHGNCFNPEEDETWEGLTTKYPLLMKIMQ